MPGFPPAPSTRHRPLDTGLLAVLLLGLGLAVLVVEVFVPSGGLLAVFTLVCLVGSVIAAFSEWWGEDPAAFWLYVGSVVILVPGTVIGAFLALPRTRFGRRLLQEAPTPEELAPLNEEAARLAALVGRRGVTLTPHSPGGMVEVDGVRHHAEARGLMLDPGEPVEVVALRGRRLVVRPADGPVPVAAENPEPADDPPVPPVIDPSPARPGGAIAADAPVGYAPPEPKPDPSAPPAPPAGEPDRIDFEVPEDSP